ncbi:unnamed protein product [Onchocerca flexuosa]|uniref:Uncharacterized protein n=1 Tax=Onchocerca flexuosa TaxID=387005 RepID=A0A183HX02_9BILA|nr:unnamed protein product [Onchocerca flexuosa]
MKKKNDAPRMMLLFLKNVLKILNGLNTKIQIRKLLLKNLEFVI